MGDLHSFIPSFYYSHIYWEFIIPIIYYGIVPDTILGTEGWTEYKAGKKTTHHHRAHIQVEGDE